MSDTLTFDLTALPEILGSQFGDWLFGTEDAERISGLEGDDHLYGSGGDDELDGGAGDDWLEGGTGNDLYLFGRGGGRDGVVAGPAWLELDTIVLAPGITPADVVGYRGEEYLDDAQYFDDLVLQIKGSRDRIIVADYFSERPGVAVRFAGGAVWDTATLDRKDVTGIGYPVGGSGTLEGGAGPDYLYGSEGNDHLHGAAGDDVLSGQGGSDIYYFGRGGGHDTILYGLDSALVLGHGIFASDLRVQRDGRDVALRLDGSEDQVTVAPHPGVDALDVRFADGMVWDAAAIDRILAGSDEEAFGTEADDALEGGAGDDFLHGAGGQDVLHGGSGDDWLEGGWGRDTYYFGLGDGRDSVHEFEYQGSDEIVLGPGLSPADIAVSSNNRGDLILQVKDRPEQLTLAWYLVTLGVSTIRFADGATWDAATIERKVYVPPDSNQLGTAGSETLEGTIDSDFLNGEGGNDFLHGDAGDDWLHGGAGDDTYYFGRGGGRDFVVDDDTGNTLVLGHDISAADIVATVDFADLVLEIAGTPDRITFSNHFGMHPVLRTVRFADGLQWDAGAIERNAGFGFYDYPNPSPGEDIVDAGPGDQGIMTLEGDDLLHGGAGNDWLNGGPGNDTYYFGWGGGQDTIYDDWMDGRDVLLFTHGIALADVAAARDGDDLVLGLKGSSDEVRLSGYFFPFGPGFGIIRFFDGGSLDFAAIERMFAAAAADPLGTAQGDTLYGGLGDQGLAGGAGDDFLFGGAGDDSLSGGTGNDTYYFGFGSGNDSIIDHAGVNMVRFAADVAPEAIAFGAAGDELILTLTATGDALRVQRSDSDPLGVADLQFARGRTLPVLRGSDQDDFVYGTAGRDLFVDGAGADMLQGGAGDDVYLARDWVTDTWIEDLAQPGAGNQLLLPLWTQPDDIQLSWSHSWLELRVAGTGGAIRLAGFDHLDALGWRAVERFELSDGTSLAYDELLGRGFVIRGNDYVEGTNLQDVIYGGSGLDLLAAYGGDDILLGGAGNDTLHGGDGDDELAGGSGNDSLVGDAGSDTYIFERSSGHDRIFDMVSNPGDEDEVVFGLGIRPENLMVTRDAYNGLIVSIVDADASLLFNAWFDPGLPAHVERFVFQDGPVLSDATIEAMINDAPVLAQALADQIATDGLPFAFVVAAGAFADADIADSLTLSASLPDGSPLPDWLVFQPKERTFAGTPGTADIGTLAVRVTATDPAGASAFDEFLLAVQPYPDQVLTGTPGSDLLVGHSGNDTLNGLAGTDTMIGKEGNDVYYVDRNTDIVTEAAGAGSDLVYASASYTLPVNVEDLVLTGTAGISGTGNSFDNRITGNSGINTLNGGAGNDTLDGGENRDSLNGGTGDDTYSVDHSSDRVTEGSNAGTDLVRSSVTFTLPSNVEYLLLTGTAAINGTGNGLANYVLGNDAGNYLTGGGGNDLLQGSAGDDWLNDTSGRALLDAGMGNDMLTGGNGRELLIGGRGNDALTTGGGADIIAFNLGDGQDTVAASTGTDNIVSLGGGVRYEELALRRAGNSLVLEVSAVDSITFTDWYLNSTNRSVGQLQVVSEATPGYDPGGVDPLLLKKVQSFDFSALVAAFDEAHAQPGPDRWTLMHKLLDTRLSAADDAALGGDLAYQYGLNGGLAGVSASAAHEVLASTQFASQSQALRPLEQIQAGPVKLV